MVKKSIDIVKWESTNHFEMEIKRLELNKIEDDLAQKELELATLQGELYAFEIKYLRMVGVYFAELDDIRAKIAGALARLHVEDETLQEEAERARTQARESAEASEAARLARESILAPLNPSAELKTRFRDLAKRILRTMGETKKTVCDAINGWLKPTPPIGVGMHPVYKPSYENGKNTSTQCPTMR